MNTTAGNLLKVSQVNIYASSEWISKDPQEAKDHQVVDPIWIAGVYVHVEVVVVLSMVE